MDWLLGHTASLTTRWPTADAVIGRIINNLNAVLGTVDERGSSCRTLIASCSSSSPGWPPTARRSAPR